ESHLQLSVCHWPFGARPVAIDLDAEPVWIAKIKSFAHEVIGLPGVRVDVREVSDESSEITARRQQNREVVQSETPVVRMLARSLHFVELYENPVLAERSQRCVLRGPIENPQADHGFVIIN